MNKIFASFCLLSFVIMCIVHSQLLCCDNIKYDNVTIANDANVKSVTNNTHQSNKQVVQHVSTKGSGVFNPTIRWRETANSRVNSSDVYRENGIFVIHRQKYLPGRLWLASPVESFPLNSDGTIDGLPNGMWIPVYGWSKDQLHNMTMDIDDFYKD